MAAKNNDCKPCREAVPVSGNKNYTALLPGILLVALPKCPFCFMAFSSTMLLCGEGSIMEAERIYQSTPTIMLSALFCLTAIAGILLVRRDVRTFYALLLALTGTAMVVTSVAWGGGMPLYYAGAFLIFTGVWLNSSLLYVLGKLGISSGIDKWPGSTMFSLQTKNKKSIV